MTRCLTFLYGMWLTPWLERLWGLHPWGHTEPNWIQSWAASSSWSWWNCSRQSPKVPPASAILWLLETEARYLEQALEVVLPQMAISHGTLQLTAPLQALLVRGDDTGLQALQVFGKQDMAMQEEALGIIKVRFKRIQASEKNLLECFSFTFYAVSQSVTIVGICFPSSKKNKITAVFLPAVLSCKQQPARC